MDLSNHVRQLENQFRKHENRSHQRDGLVLDRHSCNSVCCNLLCGDMAFKSWQVFTDGIRWAPLPSLRRCYKLYKVSRPRLRQMQEMMEAQSELPKLRWCMDSIFTKNMKARDEWRTKAGTLASGKIRYTIQFGAVSVHWRIFLQGEQSSFAQGRGLSLLLTEDLSAPI